MFEELVNLARLTLSAPRQAARIVLAWPIERAATVQLAVLMVVLSVVISQLSGFVLPVEGPAPMAVLLRNPAMNAAVHGVVFVISVFAAHRIGKAFGGTGTLDGTLKLMTWLQAVNAGLLLLQLVLLMVMPLAAGLIGFASLILILWLLTNFVAELHGFPSLMQVFMAIVLSFFAIVIGLSLLLGLLTMLVPGGMQNV